jgi:Arc/MetJ-type ribon-helix-helix transcriptional regulator
MNQSLPHDIQQRIDAQIASGIFATGEDVLREALDGLERRQRGLARLREMVAAAERDIAAGRVGTFDREEIKRDVRGRLSAHGIGE